MIDFNALPDDARLWAFTAGEPLDGEQKRLLAELLDPFITQWAAHGADLAATWMLVDDMFLLIGVDQSKVPPSGCSIDALTRFLREVSAELGVDFLDAPNCCYRTPEGSIRCVDRSTFERLAAEEIVGADTVVFDLTVLDVGGVRGGKFETRAATSWYGKAFRLS